MLRLGSGYSGSPKLLNSGSGNYEVITDNKSFYKFEFVSKESEEVEVKINNSDSILVWNGYFSTDEHDAEIHSFVIVTPNIEFYWYGAY